jgi:hypothetical protein
MKTDMYFLATLTLLPHIAFANDPNSGFRLADVYPKNKSSLHTENVIRGGKAYNVDIVSSSSGRYKEANKTLNPCFTKAPSEQYPEVRYANLNHKKPPSGYENGGVIGWVNAVNNGTAIGSVLVRSLKIWGIDSNGTRNLVDDKIICDFCDAENHIWGYDMPRSLWRDPAAWNRSNHGSVFQVIDNAIVKIPTSTQPSDLFHFWNTTWPRAAVNSEWTYEVEAEVLPQGAGMIQIGLDFWSSQDGGINIEAANSQWICAKPDANWITVRAGGIR